MAVLLPLLSIGWTFEDIGKCTHLQLLAAVEILKRGRILEGGSGMTEDMVKDRPDMMDLYLAYLDEKKKLQDGDNQ